MGLPALLPWLASAAPVISTAISGIFGRSNAKQQQGAAMEAMGAQNMMNVENYKNRYQWTVEDMKAAGLNPILAASGGFSVGNAPTVSLPQMSQAPTPMFDFGSSAKSASEISGVMAEVKKKEAEIRKIGEDTLKTIQETAESRARQNLMTKQEAQIVSEIEVNFKRLDQLSSQARLFEAQIDRIGIENKLTSTQTEQSKANINLIKKEAETLLYKIQELRKQADVYDSMYGSALVYVKETLKSIGAEGIISLLVGAKLFGKAFRRTPKAPSWQTIP